LTGYGDIGFFVPQGNGSGIVWDAGKTFQYTRNQCSRCSEFGWVFYGDILAPAINSRGDVSDLGDLPGSDRFDPIHSRGNPAFLVNELNLGVQAGLGDRLLFSSSVNFLPRRAREEFSFGDTFDVDLVQLEWLPTSGGQHSIF